MGHGTRWRWPWVVGVVLVVVVLLVVAVGAQPGAPGEVYVPVPPVKIDATPEAVEAVLRGHGIPATGVRLGSRELMGWPPAYSFDTLGVAFSWGDTPVRARIELGSGMLIRCSAGGDGLRPAAGDIAIDDAKTAARVADEWFALLGVPLARSRPDTITSLLGTEWLVHRMQVLPSGVATLASSSVALDALTGAVTMVDAAPWLADDTRLPAPRITAKAAADRVLTEYGAGTRSGYRGVAEARVLRVQRGMRTGRDDDEAGGAFVAWRVWLRAEAVKVYADGQESQPSSTLIDAWVDEQSGELISYTVLGIDTMWLAEEVLGADDADRDDSTGD